MKCPPPGIAAYPPARHLPAMRQAATTDDLRREIAALPRPLVLVPTMGALHEGHLALMRRAREAAGPHGTVAVSIFVNPIQFDRPGDLAAYPQPLADDLAQCAAEGVDLVFTPAAGDTFTGNRGLQLEEPLIFEQGQPDRCGVDLPAPPKVTQRLGAVKPRAAIGLPGLAEPQVVQHYTRLSQKNYAIDMGVYPLGSCTMKHNPRINEKVARLTGIGDLHPLQPVSSVQGALELIDALAHWLKTLTGMPAVAMSPAAGAHGERAWADELHTRHRGLDAAHHGLEDAHVEGDVVVEHRELGGAVLRLAQLQPPRDAVAARGGRAGEDEARLGERERRVGVEAELAAHREDRPVGAPQHDGAAGVDGHPVALRSRSSRRIGAAGGTAVSTGANSSERPGRRSRERVRRTNSPRPATLTTPRLLLRPWREDDLVPFAALNADSEVMRHFPALLTREESDAMAHRLAGLVEEQGWGIWALERRDTGEFVGFTGLAVPRFALPFLPAFIIAVAGGTAVGVVLHRLLEAPLHALLSPGGRRAALLPLRRAA